MNSHFSNAPFGTCNGCGWSGRDWGFKYHPRFCTKCYKKWGKKQAEVRRVAKPVNEILKIADSFVITRNVRNRLMKEAQTGIPFSAKWHKAKWTEVLGMVAEGISILLILLFFGRVYSIIGIGVFVVGMSMIIIAERVMALELVKREPKLTEHFEQLVRERQKRIDETLAFYQSAEWKLIRSQVIKEHERICRRCGKMINDYDDLTVDHILPRSKFPQRAFDKSNLQILCRSCNSQKSDDIDIYHSGT